MINPLVIKRYAQMKLLHIKSDRADAALIMQYAQHETPALWGYACTWTARTYNPTCKKLYQQLQTAGKPPKVIGIAIAHTLCDRLSQSLQKTCATAD